MVVGTGDSRSANVPGIGPKAGKFYVGARMDILKRSGFESPANRVEEPLAGRRVRATEVHSPTQDDQTRIDHMDHAGNADGEVIAGLLDEFQAPGISLLGGFEDPLGGNLVDLGCQKALGTGLELLAGSGRDPRGARIGFQMASASPPSAQAGLGARIDDHVPAFSAEAVATDDQLVVDDDPSADPRTEGQKHHAIVDFPCSDPEFSKSSSIGVVGVGHREFERLFEGFDDRKMMPMGMVRWLDQHAFSDVLATGCAQSGSTDTRWVQTELLEDRTASLRDATHRIGRALGFKRIDRTVPKRCSLVVGQSDLDACASDVDPEEVGRLGLIERCGFLLGHDGEKKEGAAEGLSGENRLLDKQWDGEKAIRRFHWAIAGFVLFRTQSAAADGTRTPTRTRLLESIYVEHQFQST